MAHKKLQQAGAAALLLTSLLPNAGALSNVSTWAEKDVAQALKNNIEPAVLTDAIASAPITRAEFCSIAVNLYEKLTDTTIDRALYNVSDKSDVADPEGPAVQPFIDCTDTDVLAAYDLGLVSGRGDGIFDPNATISRQDLCVMLENVLKAADKKAPAIVGDAVLEDYPDVTSIHKYALSAMTTMIDYSVMNGIQTTLNKATFLFPSGTATREQALIMAQRFADAFAPKKEPEVTITPAINTAVDPLEIEEAADKLDSDYIYAPLDNADKMALVYGEGGEKFTNEADAVANMTDICVKVWRLQTDGTKTPGLAYLTVNANIADLYIAVFDEIFQGSEQFPIKDAGSYNWRTGEHSQGTAIDINWEENMEATINSDGTLSPTCGTHWTPGIDPFSIPENGDVYNAFIKYGFIWGGNAWHSKRDYMHFSYFGT